MRGAILGVMIVLAGCLGGTPSASFDDVQDDVHRAAQSVLRLEHAQERGHYDMRLHAGAMNVERIAYSNGFDNTGDPNQIPAQAVFTEFAIQDGYAYLARHSTDGTQSGISIVDVHEPARPLVVGNLATLGLGDIEVSRDGAWLFASTQRNLPQEMVNAASAGATALPRGIYVVDIADKTFPAVRSFVPMPPNGPHTLTYVNHPNGSSYLVACTYDLVTDPVSASIAGSLAVTQRVVVFLLVPDAATGMSLVPVAEYQALDIAVPQSDGEEPRLVFPHDTRARRELATGRFVLDVAYWDLGVHILDFSEPPQLPTGGSLDTLQLLGTFATFAPSAYNNLHLVQAFETHLLAHTPSGKTTPVQVLVTEPEIIQASQETGQITFLDATMANSMSVLGYWTLPPVDPALGVSGLNFSPHNFDLFDGKVALAHNHAGLWIVDVSTPDNLAAPKTVGFYMGNLTRTDSPVPQPFFWGVFEHDGLLYASDEATGLHILRFSGP